MPLDGVLQITELLRIISQPLGNKDILQTALGSHRLFHLLMPVLWETVCGASQLFALVKGTKISQIAVATVPYEIIRLPHVVHEEALVRLRLYGGFVKYITVFKSNHIKYELLDWEALWIQARDRPLLPNLDSCSLSNDFFISYPQLPWLTLFISPVLRELRVEGPSDVLPPSTPPRACCLVFRTLIEKCSTLSVLAIFPDEDMQYEGADVSIPGYYGGLNQHNETYDFGSFFQHTRSLTSLKTTSFILLQDNILQLITSGFDTLECLDIYQGVRSGDLPFAALPSGAFPALKHLGFLYFFDDTTTRDFYRLLPEVTKRLVSLEIKHDNRRPNKERCKLALVSSICQGSPYLTDLSLQLTDGLSGSIWEAPPEVLQSLAVLPLRRLSIVFATIVGASLNAISTLFPDLVSLKLPYHSIALIELYEFVERMPCLECIGIGLQLSGTALDVPNIPIAPHCSALRAIESDFKGEVGPDSRLVLYNHQSYQVCRKFARYVHMLSARCFH
ncbi:hypothetical protein FRC09_005347 [Ceratobasidium sp. 395]|nr:hypothetical protein FRC09_005347 [Ceratobasidium sp. 395]